MRRSTALCRALFRLFTLALALHPPAADLAAASAPPATGGSDLQAARTLFEKNLDAIRRRDRNGYLACYLHAETLARTGFEGPSLG